MSGFLLRLAGPMQSWGEHSMFGERDTLPYPSRSGLIGMFAAAQGVRRGDPLDRYKELKFTVRVDRPGVRLVDFHTIGGGLPKERTVPTAAGKRLDPKTATIVTRRSYLADAVFTVAVTGPEADTIADALAAPYWQPYLGRRAFVPDPLLVLRRRVADPVRELVEAVPLPHRRVEEDAATVLVDLIYEEGEYPDTRTLTVLNDVPLSFDSKSRRYSTRQIRVVPTEVPATLVAGPGRDYQNKLFTYVKQCAEEAA